MDSEKQKQKKTPYDEKVKIGIAFGGGGAKGFAHVGVLKVLEKYGIKADFIAGSSVGAILGATYALGYNGEEILERAVTFKKKFSTLRNFNFFSESLIKDKVINRAIKEVVGEHTTFEDLKIPFVATAVDLESGQEISITQGKLWEVARASSAIPFVFTPVFLNGKYVIDGGTLNNVPVDYVRKQNNIDIVICVDLGGMTSRQYISAMVWEKYYRKPKTFEIYPSFLTKWKLNMNLLAHIFLRTIDIMRKVGEKQKMTAAQPDIFIKPDVETISLLEFERHTEAVESGMKAAEEIMPKLLDLIEQKKQEKITKKRQQLVENNEKS